MDEKVLVLDIDGTLTNSQKEITSGTKQAIRETLKRGHKVILASGRPTPGMYRYEKELELEKFGGYLLSFNGGRIVECRTGEVVYQRTLPGGIIPGLYRFAADHGCGLVTYFGDHIISAFAPDPYVELESRINGMEVRVVENFKDFVDFEINKCLLTAPPELAEGYERELAERYGDILSVYRSEPFFIEIMPKNVDKATSLDHMLETIGLTRENAICCGDGFNDISMIQYAGVGVAMGNAQPAVKEAADYITDTNDRDGLVQVMEKFILSPESMGQKKEIKISVPEKAQQIIDKITAAGFEAYVVGGCVRDSILGREPEDWDITTSAKPEQVKALFPRTIDTGIQHGTVTVMLDKQGFEVTTYRIDGKYEDNRHPREVTFTPNLREDLKRRDFTINAMAYNEETGLVDLYGGLEDIERKVIRCVGNAEERFTEDALRIMRAIRFSAQLGYTIEEETRQAIRKLAPNLATISAERIRVELEKLLVSPHPDYLRDAYEMGVTKVFLPEFDVCMETPQNHPHHRYNVGEHILHSVMEIEPDRIYRIAMLLHDIGKPATLETDEDGITHFHGHNEVGEVMAREILQRLRFDNDTIYRVCKMVLYHDYGNSVEPGFRVVRRAINRIGEDVFPMLFPVKRADVLAQSDYLRQEKLDMIDAWEQIYGQILAQKQCFCLRDLALSGKDLIALGYKPGPEIGQKLQELLELVLDDPECNTRERLMDELKKDKRKA